MASAWSSVFLEVSSPPMIIRAATQADLPAVQKLSKGIFFGADALVARFTGFLKDPTRHIAVAEVDGEVVSCHFSSI